MKVVELSGGVGGARLARGLHRVDEIDLTIVVNVGDDEDIHGLHVSPDVDTVVYTLAGIEGPEGWGRRGDTFATNEELARLGADNRFRLGDLDLAMNILRTEALGAGVPLSRFTAGVVEQLGIGAAVIPATDSRARTRIETAEGELISFQEYFVLRGHRDTVARVDIADPVPAAPGVLEAIASADVVMIAPSNPPLSIWPILAIEGVEEAVRHNPRVVAVSPLFGGKALKGPAARVMRSIGLPDGNEGVVEAYRGLIDELVVDTSDGADVDRLSGPSLRALPTHIIDPGDAEALCRAILFG